MTASEAHQGRWQQRRRTRKDLLEAAARLLKQGQKPTLEEAASEAQVSRATAYRYFASAEALLAEAALDVSVPPPQQLFAHAGDDAVARVMRVDAALHDTIAQNETAIRVMLARSMEQRADSKSDLPVRQNRRSPLIEEALAPARKEFAKADLTRLESALAVVVGTESWVVFRDVLQVSDKEAAKVRAFMIRALIDAAKKR